MSFSYNEKPINEYDKNNLNKLKTFINKMNHQNNGSMENRTINRTEPKKNNDENSTDFTREAIENLRNYTILTTDNYSPEVNNLKDVPNSYKIGGMINIIINDKASKMEFVGLMNKINWEAMYLPDSNCISYISIVALFDAIEYKSPNSMNKPPTKNKLPTELGDNSRGYTIDNTSIVLCLMALGDKYGIWKIIDPTKEMKNTKNIIKTMIGPLGLMVEFL